MEVVEDVVIIGAGIAGLATAVAFKRVGVRSLILEKSQTTGAALSLFPNAWLALMLLVFLISLLPFILLSQST